MLLEKEREKIVEYGKKLITSGLTKGTGGNLSIYNPSENLMAISPSGIDYFLTKPSDVVVMNLDGKIVDGDKKPSSEYHLHSIFYKNRTDIKSIVHTHTMYSTVIASLGWDLPAIHYVLATAGKNVRCAKYATYGSQQLAKNAYDAMIDRKAVLLANHGLLTGSDTIESAFSITEDVEYTAELYYRAKSIANPVIISDEEMNKISIKFKSYGQKDDSN